MSETETLDEKHNFVTAEYCKSNSSSGSNNSLNQDQSKYSVDDALREIGLGLYHFKWVPVIAMSGFSQSSMISLAPLLIGSLERQWNLDMPIEVLLLFVVFFGAFPGTVMAGVFSDKRGRKLPLILGQLLILICTVLSTISFNYIFFSVCYFFIGVSIGMLGFVSVVLLSELSPPSFRTYSVALYAMCSVLGALYSCVTTYLLVNSHGWEIITFVVAIPHVVISIFVLLVDESPKYLAISGQIAAAEQVLNRMALQNGSDLQIIGKLAMRVENNRGSLGDVVGMAYRRDLFLLSSSIGCVGLIVYSSYTMIPYMIKTNHCSYFNSTNLNMRRYTLPVSVVEETSVITVSEVAMIMVFAVLTEFIGRIKTLRLLSVILLASSFSLVFCLQQYVFMICLYIQRGAGQSLLLLLLIYTPECFPTHIRGAGSAMTLAALLLGGLVSSTLVYPVGVLHGFSHLAIALSIAAAGTLVSVLFFNNETVGIDLP